MAVQNKQCLGEVLLGAFSHCKGRRALRARDGDGSEPEEPSLPSVAEPASVSLPQEQ